MRTPFISLLIVAACCGGCTSSRTLVHPMSDLPLATTGASRDFTRIQIAPSGPGALESRLTTVYRLRASGDSVVFRRGGKRVFESLGWEQVEEVRIETANPRSRTAPAVGAVIGAVVGGIGGYAMGYARGDDPPSDCCFDLFGECPEQQDCRLISLSAEQNGILAMIMGATVGLAAGTFLGYMAKTSLRKTRRFRNEPRGAVAWEVQPLVGVDRRRGVVLHVRF